MRPHEHLADPDLLQALVDPEAGQLRKELERCADCARRARELEAFVERVRRAQPGPVPSADFAERVLRRTTRAAPVPAEQLQLARIARWAAAAAIVAGFGALAWWLTRSRATLVTPQSPSTVHVVPQTDPAPSPLVASGDRELEAQRLRSGALPAVDDIPKPEDPLPLLLWARSRQAQGHRLPVGPVETLPWRDPSGVERALWLELLTDRWVLTGDGLDRLRRAANDVLDHLAGVGKIEVLALARAERLGALDESASERLAGALTAPDAPSLLARRTDATVDDVWRTALCESAPVACVTDVVVARWVNESH